MREERIQQKLDPALYFLDDCRPLQVPIINSPLRKIGPLSCSLLVDRFEFRWFFFDSAEGL